MKNLFMGSGRTECDSRRASDHVHRHAPSWRQAVAACLVSFLAALAATSITVHNAANADKRHHVAVPPGQIGADNHAMDSMIVPRQAMAACRLSSTGQACAVRTTLLTEEDTATGLAAPPSVKGVAFSPDGRLLAGAYSDGTIWLWNRATGQAHALTLPASSPISANSVAFSPDGRLLAGAYSDGSIRLWNPATGQAHALTLPASSPISANSVAFSPDGRLLAGAYSDGSIRLWNPATGQVPRSFLQTGPGAIKGADGVAFSPDGRLLAGAYSDGTVWQWNPVTGQGALLTVPSAASADAVAFSPDGTLLASAYTDGAIRLWNPATGRGMVLTVPSAASADAVAFSPDGTLLASAYTDGTIRLWNLATGRLARSPFRIGPGAQGNESGVAFSPDGNLLASAYGNGTLRLWNLETSQHGGLASGGWPVTTVSVIAIVLSAFAAAITTREIRRAGRRLPSTGGQLWRFCC